MTSKRKSTKVKSVSTKGTSAIKIFQLKVILKDSKPSIWRRILVKGNTKLNELHEILQTVMGWYNCHLHQFIINGEYYGVPIEDDFMIETIDEKKVKLSDFIIGEKYKFKYEYDMGDDWIHDILVEKILELEQGKEYPICIAGKNACPPEDCGGIYGYYGLLDILKDPKHPEYESYLEWIGEDFDPTKFNLEEVNFALSEL